MIAKYILAALAVAFLAAAAVRGLGGGGLSHPQTKTWLIIGVIFAAVSAWLFSTTRSI
jgi:hypothetical protein